MSALRKIELYEILFFLIVVKFLFLGGLKVVANLGIEPRTQ